MRRDPATAEKDRSGLGGSGRFAAVTAVFFVLLVIAAAAGTVLGSVDIGAGKVLSLLRGGLDLWLRSLFSRDPSAAAELDAFVRAGGESQILFHIRLPRVLLAAVLGGSLSVSGYLLQVFFRNPIAGPFVLGISSGARMAVGMTLIFLGGRIGALSSMSLVAAAFAGSLLITCLVLLFSQRVRSMSMLLVVGIMAGYICGAVTDFCISFAADQEIAGLTAWSMGSFSGADWDDVRIALGVCLPGLFAALLMIKPVSVYALGEGYARSMGVRTGAVRVLLILVSSLLSACVTALAGPVSFVGIAVPHISRSLLRSSKPSRVITASFIFGAFFCVACDLIARTAFAPSELAIGSVTALFGAPVVIRMMMGRRREEDA
ncbi:MAG: iron ABC transporter permease [Firmicutes bacterium]|nr:iron ABC transporter permease [Bacillota bacterium]